MNDRGMKKWRPFNAVAPGKELLKREIQIEPPSLSKDEESEYEELLTNSLYTHSKIEITYYEDNQIKVITDHVIKLDSIKKNIYLKNKTINFRQIYRVK